MSVDLRGLRHTLVSLADTPVTLLPALLTEYRWNGWECPYFARGLFAQPWVRRMFDENAALINETSDGTMRAEWNDELNLPSIVSVFDDEYEEVQIVPTRHGAELVTIGWAAFTWMENR